MENGRSRNKNIVHFNTAKIPIEIDFQNQFNVTPNMIKKTKPLIKALSPKDWQLDKVFEPKVQLRINNQYPIRFGQRSTLKNKLQSSDRSADDERM